MCLDNFNKPRGKIAPTNLKNKIAYKMMEGVDSIQKRKKLFNYWKTATSIYIDGRWNVDKKKGMINEAVYSPYPTGYHAYLREDDAKEGHIFCKVEFDDVVAVGYQKGPVVVARKMRVLEVWRYEYSRNSGCYGKWKCVRKNKV